MQKTPEDGSLKRVASGARSLSERGATTPLWRDHVKPQFARVELGALEPRRGLDVAAGVLPVPVTLSLFAIAFLFLAWPWLSGAVTIPWDAKSQFLPPLQFLATSLASHQSPLWTSNVFAGWPLISDPQSLMFSPLHFLLAYVDRAPSLGAFDSVTFAYLFLGGAGIILYFHDRGWHAAGALVAALAFAFGGSASSRLQHTNQIMDLAYFALALWVLARALQRSSLWTGAAAGIVIGLLALGREQVALISLYVLVGLVVAHWIGSENWRQSIRASIKPLAAASIVATLIATVPVVMTALLCAESNRPEIAWSVTGLGSLHPAHLLTLAFPDLYGVMKPSDLGYWGPGTLPWKQAFGAGEVNLAQNMGLVYAGALPLVVTFSLGIVRGLAWSRDIRFFSIAAGVVLLYALGWHTPAFHAMYELMPGLTLFRRPADATFVLGALLAIITGYLVHRWLEGSVPPPTWTRRMFECVTAIVLIAAVLGLAHTVATVGLAIVPVASALAFTGGAIAVLFYARRLNALTPLAAALLLTAFAAADLAWNNKPHMSTGLPPQRFDALRLDTKDETVVLLKSELAATTAPNRRDRVELTGIGYHWPNLCMIHDCDHVFGHNPLRLKSFNDATGAGDTVADYRNRHFSPLFPSYRSAFADLLGLRFIALGAPVEKVDPSLRPGDLSLIAHTKDAYVYENRRALPRVMLMTDWRVANFDALIANGWPSDVDPRRTVLLRRAPADLPAPAGAGAEGTASLTRYANTEVIVDVNAPSGGILLLNDVWHPWWRATVDGRATTIMKANVTFRAVVIPPGKHTVRFTFHPVAGLFAELAAKLGVPTR